MSKMVEWKTNVVQNIQDKYKRKRIKLNSQNNVRWVSMFSEMVQKEWTSATYSYVDVR